MKPLLLLPAYLAPIQHYAHILKSQSVVIEQHSHYEKKTYRNRATIMGANGIIDLSIPVINQQSLKLPDKDIKLSYDTPWQANHWKTIVSAYQSSPYFEYYADDFAPFYKNKFTFLLDYNMQLMATVLEAIGINAATSISINYINNTHEYSNLKKSINPKLPFHDYDTNFKPVEYRQVFREKFGFVPNLSIIDLIFCKGPESILVLEDSLNLNA